MEMKIKILGVILVVIMISSLFLITNISGAFVLEGQTDLVKVRMGNLPVIHALPVYLAIEKGYFKEAGIDLELIELEAPNQIIDGLIQGRLDFTSTSGAAGVSGVANYKNPGKIKLYALSGGTTEQPGDAVVVPIDSEIKSISELKGKKLGIMGGSIQWRMLAKDLLAKNGFEMDKDVFVVEIAIGTHVTALASKQVDALLTIEPVISTVINNKIGKIISRGPLEELVADPFYPGAGLVSVKFAQENPEVTAKIIEIIRKANIEVQENPDEARQYLKKYTPLNDELAKTVSLAVIKTCDKFEQSDIEALQKFYDIFLTYGVVESKINVEDIIYCKK